MLRSVAKSSLQRASRQQSSVSGPSKKSGGKGLALAVGSLVAGGSGVVGYAYLDPEFRHKVEAQLPAAKPVFNAVIGASREAKSPFSKIKDDVVSALPKKKSEEPILPPLEIPSPPARERVAVNVDPVDVSAQPASHTVADPQIVAAKNKQLENALLSAIQSAETVVRVATEAKMKTINAVDNHAQLLKQTVENPQSAGWEKVTDALQHSETLSRKDGSAEADGRNYIDNLRKIIAEGKTNSTTSNNPLLINATETANKLSHQMDELNALVNKSRQESSILNQYKDLIDRSREQFALEMKSILPSVDLHAKDKKLNEDELNALIAHAHLKVDQLRKQLADQQAREEQHIARAIEEQRAADERIAAERLQLELRRAQMKQELDIDKAVMSQRSSWETELEDQLKRTAAAHSEHLEQVIRTQRQLFEIEQSQKVEEAVLIERDHHSKVVGAALSRLEGIEHALGSRVALDAENRQAKQFWIACHNLIDTIKHGMKSGDNAETRRFPLAEPLSVLKEVNPEDQFVNVLSENFPSEARDNGVYTEQDLKNRFSQVYKLGRRTASIDVNGGSLSQYFWSYLRSLVLLDIPRKFSVADQIDPQAIDNIEVLSRAKWFVDRGDFEGALRIAQLLKGEPAQLAQSWIQDTRSHLESLLLAELLVAHAAVSSIRSTY